MLQDTHSHKEWYCSEDGGIWNARVKVLWQIPIRGTLYCVVDFVVKNGDAKEPMLVKASNLHDTPQ